MSKSTKWFFNNCDAPVYGDVACTFVYSPTSLDPTRAPRDIRRDVLTNATDISASLVALANQPAGSSSAALLESLAQNLGEALDRLFHLDAINSGLTLDQYLRRHGVRHNPDVK